MNFYKNNFIYINILIYLILALFFRFIIPGIDEPDWTLRIKKIILGHDDYSSFINKPLNLFSFFSKDYQEFFLTYDKCNLIDSPLKIWFSFSYFDCVDKLKIIFIKYFIFIVFFLPLFLAILFQSQLQKIFKLNFKRINNNIELVSLCILFPAFIYSANFTSYETLCLFLAMVIFIFKESKEIILLIFSSILLIDTGFFLILLIYYIFLQFFLFLCVGKNLKIITLILISLTLVNLFTKNYNSAFLEYLPFIGEKIKSINDYTAVSGHSDKYFILIRPLTIFTGLIFMTAYKTKAVFLYFVFFIVFCNFLLKIKNKNILNNYEYRLNFLYFIATIFFITNIAIVFPVLSYAKYYIFIIPFIIKIFTNFYSIIKIRNFLLISNIIVIAHFALYYLF